MPGEKPLLSYLALGDSYTIGEGVEPSERWPTQLARRLRSRGVSLVEPQIIAQTGWTTDELAEAVAEALPRGPFDLVTLLVGVNDQYREYAVERYRAAFRALLTEAIACAGGHADHVLVVSIPDWGGTPFAADRDTDAVAHAIDRFNAVNREEAEQVGCRYADVTGHSRQHAGRVVDDGLHPTPDVYAAWAQLVEPEAVAVLAGGRG